MGLSFMLVVLTISALSSGDPLISKGVPPEISVLYDTDLDTWKAPDDFNTKYPYYLSGYNEDDYPIWVIEFGKWDIRSVQEETEEAREIFDKYVDQTVVTIYNSSVSKIGITPIIGIMDMDGYSLKQMTSPKTVEFVIRKLRLIIIALSNLHSAYFINTNFVAQGFLNLIKPFLGREFEKFEVYGTDQAKWKTKLLKTIPKEQLPSWYGGSPNFKPVQVFGK